MSSALLSGRLPAKSSHNGIDRIAAALVDYPEATHVIVATVTCRQVTTKTSTGEQIPTAQIERIEAFRGGTFDADRLLGILLDRQEERTGQCPLPLGEVAD